MESGSLHGVSRDDQNVVLSSLEPDQLVEAKKKHIPRRRFKDSELVLLWGLRVYLIFMLVVVAYQVVASAR